MPSGRVHPVNDNFERWSNTGSKPSHTAPVGRQGAYEVDEGINDGAEIVSPNVAGGDMEVTGKTNGFLSKRVVLFVLVFVCLMSITTFILTVFMISGKIGNSCSCAELTTANQQNQQSANQGRIKLLAWLIIAIIDDLRTIL